MTQSVNDAIMAAIGGSVSINDRLHQFFGSSLVHAHRDGRWHAAPDGAISLGAQTLGNTTLRVFPLVIARKLRITDVGINVTTAGESGSVFRAGIYSDIATGGGFFPGALVSEFGTLAADAIATPTIGSLTVDLDPGIYWIGGAVQGAPTTQPALTGTSSTLYTLNDSSAANAIPNARTGFSQNTVSAGLPAQFSNSGAISAIPRVGYKVTLL